MSTYTYKHPHSVVESSLRNTWPQTHDYMNMCNMYTSMRADTLQKVRIPFLDANTNGGGYIT